MSEARQLALEKELKQLELINSTVSSLLSTIQTTKVNIQKTNQTTENTDKLLDKWIKILSQTHFTQNIILKPHWTGISGTSDEELNKKIAEENQLIKDLEELENENQRLEERLISKESQEQQDAQRRRDLLGKRQRELGLRNLGNRNKMTTRDRRR